MSKLERTVERREYSVAHGRRASWGAIFAGAFVSLAIMTVLGSLGVAIGAMSLGHAAGGAMGRGFGVGAGIWWVISGVVSIFFGSWIAGRLAGFGRRHDGAVHGLVTWGVTTVAMLLLLSNVIATLIYGVVTMAQQSSIGGLPGAGVTGADEGARSLSMIAWVGFFYLLATGIAAALGGRLGSPAIPRRDEREIAVREGAVREGAVRDAGVREGGLGVGETRARYTEGTEDQIRAESREVDR